MFQEGEEPINKCNTQLKKMTMIMAYNLRFHNKYPDTHPLISLSPTIMQVYVKKNQDWQCLFVPGGSLEYSYIYRLCSSSHIAVFSTLFVEL